MLTVGTEQEVGSAVLARPVSSTAVPKKCPGQAGGAGCCSVRRSGRSAQSAKFAPKYGVPEAEMPTVEV